MPTLRRRELGRVGTARHSESRMAGPTIPKQGRRNGLFIVMVVVCRP